MRNKAKCITISSFFVALFIGSSVAWAWAPVPGTNSDGCTTIGKTHSADGSQTSQTWSCTNYYITCEANEQGGADYGSCVKRPKENS